MVQPPRASLKAVLPDAADDGWDIAPRQPARARVNMPTDFEPLASERPLPTGRGLLSQAEIEMLLRPEQSAPAPKAAPAADPKPFGDLRPDSAEDDNTAAAQRIAARLTAGLREGAGLRAAARAIDCASGAFLALAQSTRTERGAAIALFSDRSGDVAALFVIDSSLAQTLVETACGGTPSRGPVRPLSPMDLALLEGLIRPVGPALSETLSFSGIETEANMAAALVPPGPALRVRLSIRTNTDEHPAELIMARSAVPARTAAGEAPATGATLGQAVTVVLTARAARIEVPLSRLTSLRAGSVLLLGLPADQPAELLSGGIDGPVAAEAQIGRKGNRIALKITRRGPALTGLNRAGAA